MELTLTLDPVVWAWGPVALSWPGLCGALGLALAVMVGQARGCALGVATPLAVRAAALGAGGGGLAVHALGGWAAAPLAAAVGVAIAAALAPPPGGYGARLRLVTTAALPGLLLGQALAYAGPLVAGDPWARPTGGPWGLIYWHPGSLTPPPLIGVPVQPDSLYAALVNVALATLWLCPGRWAVGASRTPVVLAGYLGSRVALGLARGEPAVAW